MFESGWSGWSSSAMLSLWCLMPRVSSRFLIQSIGVAVCGGLHALIG